MKSNELRDLIISAVLLAVAFGIALSGGFFPSLPDRSDLIKAMLMALVGVSLGFVLHEMGIASLPEGSAAMQSMLCGPLA